MSYIFGPSSLYFFANICLFFLLSESISQIPIQMSQTSHDQLPASTYDQSLYNNMSAMYTGRQKTQHDPASNSNYYDYDQSVYNSMSAVYPGRRIKIT